MDKSAQETDCSELGIAMLQEKGLVAQLDAVRQQIVGTLQASEGALLPLAGVAYESRGRYADVNYPRGGKKFGPGVFRIGAVEPDLKGVLLADPDYEVPNIGMVARIGSLIIAKPEETLVAQPEQPNTQSHPGTV